MKVDHPEKAVLVYFHTKREEISPKYTSHSQKQLLGSAYGEWMPEMTEALNKQCKRNSVEYITGASFKGINKQKYLYVLMQENRTLLCPRTGCWPEGNV